MKQISKSAGFISAMAAGLLAASESQFMLRRMNPSSAKSIGARIGSYAPRQSSPISPSRRFRSQDEANQRKESAALRREIRADKRYSQYCSTFGAFVRAGENGQLDRPLTKWEQFCSVVTNGYFDLCYGVKCTQGVDHA